MNINKTVALTMLAALWLTGPANAQRSISRAEVLDKAQGMWLGQIVANMAGRATEGKYSGSVCDPNESVPWVLCGPETYWPGDDDTDMEYIALHILNSNGLNPSPEAIAEQWCDHVTSSGIYISNRQAWYRMNNGWLPPATGSRAYNEHWYSIDSQITTEVLGTISPGMTGPAINLARSFARASNDGFAVHATEFQTALYSLCWFESDIETLIEQALATIPESSRSYSVVSDVLGWYRQDMLDGASDWRATRKKLYDYYGSGSYAKGRYYNWIESTVNLGATVMCLLYGQGDYKQTVQIGVLAGWDCDCNPAIAGGIVGIIHGRSGLPQELFGPEVCSNVYRNIYRPGLPDHNIATPQNIAITEIAENIAELTELNILSNGGHIELVNGQKHYYIGENIAGADITEKTDTTTPSGLVREALDDGVTVEVFAEVEKFYSNNDLNNLNQIIDGITDNSYNGIRPYRSNSSTKIGRQSDHYGISFSQPMLFDAVTFYEGDIAWGGINNNYSTDIRKGGYFEDISVEVLVNDIFMPVTDLKLSEPLEKENYYQVINLSFEPMKGNAIRIIGKPGGSETFTTILELEVWGSIYNGDLDNNAIVDIADFATLAQSYLSDTGSGNYSPKPDLDHSGYVDITDLEILMEQWLR
ncbi:MAG: ADP-ribosylglycohydrolase family protein [Sedimentisphaerales bacterium]|nr:ADP-ribosylglycohydrolase family protein [Sedimentisphaerales bacterium]